MKHLIYAGLALTALASCSQDETMNVDKSGAIGFRASLGRTTRAETTVSNMNSFNVTAVPTVGGANYFTNLAVNDAGGGTTWNTAATYYWPGTSSLNFTAYAPVSISSLVTIDQTTQKITGFEPAATVAGQKDVVAAFNAGSKSTPVAASTFGAAGVPMNFKHILSQIAVQAKCTNANLRVQVLGVKLGNVFSKGDFTFPQTETASSYVLARTNWGNLSAPADYGVQAASSAASPVTLNTTAQSIMFGTDNFMMVPQDLDAYNAGTTPGGSYIGVLCRMESSDGAGNYTPLYPAATGYAYAAVPIGTEWVPGKKYTYVLEFGNGSAGGSHGGGGIVPPNQTNPTPGGGGITPIAPTTPTLPTSPAAPGTPILDQPIKFTVTVENWSDQTENVSM